jgi:hypothetical protein
MFLESHRENMFPSGKEEHVAGPDIESSSMELFVKGIGYV